MSQSISPALDAVLRAYSGETDLNKLQEALDLPEYALVLACTPGIHPTVRVDAAQKANELLFELLADALRAIPPDDAERIIGALPDAPPDRLKFAVIFTGLEDLFVGGRQSFADVAQNVAVTDLCRLLRKLHQLPAAADYATVRSTLEDMVSVLKDDAWCVWQKLKPEIRKRVLDIDSLADKLAANGQAQELSRRLKHIEKKSLLEAYDVLCALDTISDLSTLVMMPDDIRCAVIGVVIERMGIEFLRVIFHCLKDEKKKILRSDARVAIAVADLRE